MKKRKPFNNIELDKYQHKKLVHRILGETHKINKCHVWTGVENDRGDGQVRIKTKTVMVSRLWWILNKGPIPEGFKVVKTCKDRRCLKLSHLKLSKCSGGRKPNENKNSRDHDENALPSQATVSHLFKKVKDAL